VSRKRLINMSHSASKSGSLSKIRYKKSQRSRMIDDSWGGGTEFNATGKGGTTAITVKSTEMIMHLRDKVPHGNITQIVPADSGTLFLTASGEVYIWTNREGGQYKKCLFSSAFRSDPVLVSLDAGRGHYLALDSFGSVWAWGNNAHGQLGLEHRDHVSEPALVKGVENIVQVYAGENSSMVVQRNGSIWVWGENKQGKLGVESTKQDILSATELKNTPWLQSATTNIVISDVRSWFFQGTKSASESRKQDSQKRFEELQEETQRLKLVEEFTKTRYMMLREEKDVDQDVTDEKEDDDRIKRHLNELQKEIEKEKIDSLKKKLEFEAQLQSIDEEIQVYQSKLIELTQKEDNLLKEMAVFDVEIKQLTTDRSPVQEITAVRKKKHEKREEMGANDAIKSLIHQKQAEKVAEKAAINENFNEISRKLYQLDKKMDMYNKLNQDRNEINAKSVINNTKDTEMIFETLINLNRALQDSSIDNISKKEVTFRGYGDLISQSNSQLGKLTNDMQIIRQKLTNSSVFEPLFALIEDNLTLKRQINDYLDGLMIQTDSTMEKGLDLTAYQAEEKYYDEDEYRQMLVARRHMAKQKAYKREFKYYDQELKNGSSTFLTSFFGASEPSNSQLEDDDSETLETLTTSRPSVHKSPMGSNKSSLRVSRSGSKQASLISKGSVNFSDSGRQDDLGAKISDRMTRSLERKRRSRIVRENDEDSETEAHHI